MRYTINPKWMIVTCARGYGMGMSNGSILDYVLSNFQTKLFYFSLIKRFEFLAICFWVRLAFDTVLFVSFRFLGVSINIITCFEMVLKRKYHCTMKNCIMKIKCWIPFGITQPKTAMITRYVCLWCRYIYVAVIARTLYLFRNRKYEHTHTLLEHGEND